MRREKGLYCLEPKVGVFFAALALSPKPRYIQAVATPHPELIPRHESRQQGAESPWTIWHYGGDREPHRSVSTTLKLAGHPDDGLTGFSLELTVAFVDGWLDHQRLPRGLCLACAGQMTGKARDARMTCALAQRHISACYFNRMPRDRTVLTRECPAAELQQQDHRFGALPKAWLAGTQPPLPAITRGKSGIAGGRACAGCRHRVTTSRHPGGAGLPAEQHSGWAEAVALRPPDNTTRRGPDGTIHRHRYRCMSCSMERQSEPVKSPGTRRAILALGLLLCVLLAVLGAFLLGWLDAMR